MIAGVGRSRACQCTRIACASVSPITWLCALILISQGPSPIDAGAGSAADFLRTFSGWVMAIVYLMYVATGVARALVRPTAPDHILHLCRQAIAAPTRRPNCQSVSRCPATAVSGRRRVG